MLSTKKLKFLTNQVMCPHFKGMVLENYILQRNGTHKILQKYKHNKTHKTIETEIYVVHLVWATFIPNSQSFLSIIQQNEETQPTADPL